MHSAISAQENRHHVRKLTPYPEWFKKRTGSECPLRDTLPSSVREKLMPAPKAAAFDRRVARTRKALQHALLALMLKKGYDAITVEEICAEADVGRSTFYAHFTGKDDLKRCGLEDHLRKMLLERQHQAKEGAASNERF